jgi:hypothetical protein
MNKLIKEYYNVNLLNSYRDRLQQAQTEHERAYLRHQITIEQEILKQRMSL